jgi:plasmid stabilization system protein ParE
VLAFSVPARSVSLHPDAERDIEDGLTFYSSRSVVAAERFLSDVDAALDLIAEAPGRWPLARMGVRRYVMPAFPYSIVYRVAPDVIEILAVAHAKRRPLYWTKRRF